LHRVFERSCPCPLWEHSGIGPGTWLTPAPPCDSRQVPQFQICGFQSACDFLSSLYIRICSQGSEGTHNTMFHCQSAPSRHQTLSHSLDKPLTHATLIFLFTFLHSQNDHQLGRRSAYWTWKEWKWAIILLFWRLTLVFLCHPCHGQFPHLFNVLMHRLSFCPTPHGFISTGKLRLRARSNSGCMWTRS
jgi:hypothetical protein